MQLSYVSRVICLALCSAGLLQILLEGAASAISPVLASHQYKEARRTERTLFLLLLAARIIPWVLVFGLFVPSYILGEGNPSAEHVGWICFVGALCVLLVSIACVVRMLRAAYDVHRFCRSCRAAGHSANGLPLLLHQGERPLIAVAGVLFSRLVVSQDLLDPARFSSTALEVALAHEAAHVRHHDNLKLLLFSLLPHLPAFTSTRPSLQQRWRLAAELAADEEGAQGERSRSLLLAEVLIMMARDGSHGAPRGLVALAHDSEHLRVRVERLLAAQPPASSGATLHGAARVMPSPLLSLAGLAVLLATVGCACLLFGHRAAEFLLHLG